MFNLSLQPCTVAIPELSIRIASLYLYRLRVHFIPCQHHGSDHRVEETLVPDHIRGIEVDSLLGLGDPLNTVVNT
jgi:hypothetical protein